MLQYQRQVICLVILMLAAPAEVFSQDELAAEIPESEPVDLFPLGIGLLIVRTEKAARTAVRESAEADREHSGCYSRAASTFRIGAE